MFIAGLALAPSSGSAGGLRWEAPADRCPSEAEVASRLAALVGEGELNVAADARVSPTASGWALDLRIHWGDAGERRHLEAESCDELAEAALVLLSVLAEEGRVAGVPAVESGSGRAEEPPQPEPPQPEPLALAEASEPVEAGSVEANDSLEADEPVEAIALDRGSTGAGLAPPPTRRRPPKRRALALTTGALADIGGLARPSFGVQLGVVG
ncbi:MAG: hypothetical protein KC486_00950, partial [Myxococcales bacterium]|nr:hypothetical protein [Myxococcales bacterium]